MSLPIALIVVDMQKAMCIDKPPVRNNVGAEDNIDRLLAAWRAAGDPVVFVRHISRSPSSRFFPGQSGAEFQQRFAPRTHEHVVEKNVPDAFVHTGLERWLHVRGIQRVVIAGVSTNNSVEASARTAGNLGFSTVVVSDATFAFAMPDFGGTWRSADDVHLMALANLHGEYAQVLSTEEVLAGLGKRCAAPGSAPGFDPAAASASV